ncbi:hypothetical protein MMC18_009042 [Xylographa bjoerkii]|nr:hypothetical protein [Xylographa bjoerkii]
MRILALHGYGTSGAILRSQLDTFISRADASYEFQSLSLNTSSHTRLLSSHTGLGNFVTGPFLCYNSALAPTDIQRCCDLLDDVVAEQGPFDGVLGFSQGGSLALTYLLQHEIQHPDAPPPFRFAILFSTIAAFSPDAAFGAEVLASLTPSDLAVLASFPHADFSQLSSPNADKRALVETLAHALEIAKNGGFISAETEDGSAAFVGSGTKRDYSRLPRVMHPALLVERVRVPTVHVAGQKDHAGLVELSKLMRGVCDARVMRSLVHAGGHDVPRLAKDVKAVLVAMEWAVEQSRRQVW